MTGKNPLHPLDWHVDNDAPLAVAYRLDAPCWLVMYVFGLLDSGLVDCVGFRCETYTRPIADLADVVQAVAEAWPPDRPAKGLTVNQLRVTLTAGDMLTAARQQLSKGLEIKYRVRGSDEVHTINLLPSSMTGKVRQGRHETARRDDAFYARLAVTYADLLTHYGPRGGARQHLADALGEVAGANTVKAWIGEAAARGYWLTGGRSGVPGDASPKARAINERTPK